MNGKKCGTSAPILGANIAMRSGYDIYNKNTTMPSHDKLVRCCGSWLFFYVVWNDNRKFIMNTPWECPRCRKWNAPTNPQCFCQPIKREYCGECLANAFAIFNPPLPSLDVIHAYAEDFHKNYPHSGHDELG